MSDMTINVIDDNNASRDLMSFCVHLVHHSQWTPQRILLCGSRAEISLHLKDIVQYFGINREMLDADSMEYSSSLCAVNRSVVLPETYTGDVIRIYNTDDVHTGYVRLIREKDNAEVLLKDLYSYEPYDRMHGPALLGDYKTYVEVNNYSLSDPAVDLVWRRKTCAGSCDLVHAIHSPYWPVEAAEWITRIRLRGFPSKSVIKQTVRYGCDFVQVSHNRLSNDHEWRFSFSRAELFIIKSWSASQSIVYTSLWVLNKKIASSIMCSYYFKTLMFWACEEKPTEFWLDNSLLQSVCELLFEMMKWIRTKFCANYFIPGNNMMDHLIDADLSYEMDALWSLCQSRQRITEVIDKCRRYEVIASHTEFNIEGLTWIIRSFVLYQRIYNANDTYTDLFCTDFARNLKIALYIELSDVYRGQRFHQKSVSSVNLADKQKYILKSESHFLLAVSLCESKEIDVLNNCSRWFLQHGMIAQYMSDDASVSKEASIENFEFHTEHISKADRNNSLCDRNERKCLLYCRPVEKLGNKLVNEYSCETFIEGKNVNITVYYKTQKDTYTDINAEFYKEWPGRSPTVNISWFIAKAYLANLYYTALRDVNLTIRTCDDIIEVYRQTYMNERFAENTFKVVLSTQWTNIYDNEIQELLGFLSLCSFVSDPRCSRSVYLGICPVQFALYLKVHTLYYQISCHRILQRERFKNVLLKCIDDYNDHIFECTSDEYSVILLYLEEKHQNILD